MRDEEGLGDELERLRGVNPFPPPGDASPASSAALGRDLVGEILAGHPHDEGPGDGALASIHRVVPVAAVTAMTALALLGAYALATSGS